MQTPPSKVAIIGGGISGLSALWYLLQQEGNCIPTIFEAENRVGGTLQTIRRDGFLIEQSADMFITDESDALDLCREVGIEDRLINTNQQHRRAFVCMNGSLLPIPAGFAMLSPRSLTAIWNSPLLDVAGKLRMLGEQHIPQSATLEDESLQSFVIRRFGRQAFDRLIQPLIGGIYTADPTRLSMKATMRRFLEQEQSFGSLIAAARHSDQPAVQSNQGIGARYGKFVAPRGGMQELVDGIYRRLPRGTIRLETPVERIARDADKSWNVTSRSGDETFDAVVFATAAYQTAGLLEETDAELARKLKSIPYASSAVVIQGFQRGTVGHRLDGFGFVVPQIEHRKILAGSFSSVKFADRAPQDHVLLRTFVGGALQGELLELDDDKIIALVNKELCEILAITGEPIFSQVVRWNDAMPQYHVGHLDLVDSIEKRVAKFSNLAIAGNAFHGVGIPACIRSGKAAAQKIAGVK